MGGVPLLRYVVARWPSGIACVWLRGWVCAWLQGASGRGFAHAALPFAVLRGEAGRRPIVRVCWQSFQRPRRARQTSTRVVRPRVRGLFCERGQLCALVVGTAGLRSCRVARAVPLTLAVAGARFAAWPWSISRCQGVLNGGECSRQSQGLGCDPHIQCSGRTLQVRHRVNLESSGWHTLHPKFSFLLAELGQVAHGRIVEKRHV